MNTKIFQKGAFALESGLASGTPPGWGDTDVVLGTGHALPYLALGKTKTVGSAQDNSIVAVGFADVARKTSNYVEQPLSVHNRYEGLNPMLYWIFGLEDNVQAVVCYVCSTVTTDPAPGNTYTDPDATVCTFLRKEVNKSTTYYIFRQSAAPTATSGTLTRTSGSGDATITFTARSGLLYEHVFKFDPRSRHMIDVPTDEQLSFYAAGDKKCRMAVIGVAMDTSTGIITTNAMCKKVMFSSNAGEIAKVETDFLAYDQTVDQSVDVSLWTYPAGLRDSDGLIMHHDYMVQLGEYDDAITSLTTVGVTSFKIGADIPLQVIQDTISGLYLVEPVMQGHYGFDVNVVLSRYSTVSWQAMTDAWSNAKARISATQGYYLQEFLVNYAKLISPGPTDEEVAKEDITLSVADCDTNNWSSYLYGCSLAHGPIVMRVRNATQYNQMAL